MWEQSKIDAKRDYFAKQRQTPTGHFTEFVVRVYYYILDKCCRFPGNCCLAKNLKYLEMAQIAYQGICVEPDHDYKHVIDSCKQYLKEMGYIRFEKRNGEWWIRVLRELDFLLPGENEEYMDLYCKTDGKAEIRELQLPVNPESIKIQDKAILCDRCGKKMELRNGRYGAFFGCSGFPSCKSTMDFAVASYHVLQKTGMAIYQVQRPCWKCGTNLSVYSYFPKFDLCDAVSDFNMFEPLYIIRLSVLQTIDQYMMEKYETIRTTYSKKANFTYPGNVCPHCGSLQGSNLTLNPVYDFLEEEWKQGGLQSYISQHIPISEQTLPFEEWRAVLSELYHVMEDSY